jgi:hypothetical protein
MRAGFWFIAVPLAVFGIYRFAHSGAPNPAQLEPLVRSYLESSCPGGTANVSQLDDISVGEYAEQFGGWPVYANHVESCVEHDASKPYANTSTTIYRGGQDADRKVAVAFVRRRLSGRLELYTPELFQAAQREMQQSMQHAFDNVKVN